MAKLTVYKSIARAKIKLRNKMADSGWTVQVKFAQGLNLETKWQTVGGYEVKFAQGCKWLKEHVALDRSSWYLKAFESVCYKMQMVIKIKD